MQGSDTNLGELQTDQMLAKNNSSKTRQSKVSNLESKHNLTKRLKQKSHH